MAEKHLGDEFDIHGGGIDLVFPHHENEIAQSRCAHDTPLMARFWLHNGFLQVEGEKMSKSLGNFITIHDLLQDWPGEVIRFNMLRTHYRQPIDWTRRARGVASDARALGARSTTTSAAELAAGIAAERRRRRCIEGRPQHAAGDRQAARARQGGEGRRARAFAAMGWLRRSS